jgi:hypothetical protein
MKKRIISFFLAIAMLSCVAFAADARATKAPTSYAPTSWYNTSHTFTCTYYTYSSYIVDITKKPEINFWSLKPFHVEFREPNGKLIDSVNAGWYDEQDSYCVFDPGTLNTDYYVIIYNDASTPITTNDASSFVIWTYA